MKYPNHSILDLSPTYGNLSVKVSWQRHYVILSPEEDQPRKNLTISTGKMFVYRSLVDMPTYVTHTRTQSSFTTLFDINFLRKEKLYTKLKYSRCPQYDIVSGGFAALFAGFIGFLISEKFGIELVDSGDFYIVFMYSVFAVFSLRPLIISYSKHGTTYHPLSPKYLMSFTYDLLVLTFRKIRSLLPF